MLQFSEKSLAKVQADYCTISRREAKECFVPVFHLAQDEFGGWLDVPVMDYVAELS